MELLKQFYAEEEGMGVVEIVMIIAALMCIALIFKNTITKFATNLMQNVFNQDNADAGKVGETDSVY